MNVSLKQSRVSSLSVGVQVDTAIKRTRCGVFFSQSQQMPVAFLTKRSPRWTSSCLGAKEGPNDSDEDDLDMEIEPDDVPEDWTEQDILGDFEEDPDVVDDDEEEESSDDDDENVVIAEKEDDTDDDDDDDDDDVDLDDVDLDELEEEDDDEEDSEEEIISEEFVASDDFDDGPWEEESDKIYAKGASGVPDDLEWDEDEDGGTYELVDDPDDPNYMKQKELVEKASLEAEERVRDTNFDVVDFITREITDDQARGLDDLPFFQEIEAKARDMMITEEDVDSIDLAKEVESVSDPLRDDPYPRHEEGEPNFLEQRIGLSDDDMAAIDGAYKEIDDILDEEPWDKVLVNEMATKWGDLSSKTITELEGALEELGGSAYNATRWLLYDLNFNVSNLILASVKHNPNAPILFQHWYPQLVSYERYQHARDRNFDFTWDDVEKADIDELRRYYAGFGYDEIPDKAPAETGIIGFEDLDEEEIKMAAFENWMTEVYNPEWDRTDFDDDDMRDEDNVFSDFYDPPQHPDLPALEDAEEDINTWKQELNDEDEYDGDSENGMDDPEVKAYVDMMGKSFQYEVEHDEEFEREFRGHLVIACSASPDDLQVAEKITTRFDKEFGKKVFVETRVMSLAREEDNVFEIWLESYEIDLLHSKKRATSNTQDWQGPAECDDNQIHNLVEEVRFLISDDARYSYRMDLEHTE